MPTLLQLAGVIQYNSGGTCLLLPRNANCDQYPHLNRIAPSCYEEVMKSDDIGLLRPLEGDSTIHCPVQPSLIGWFRK
jgi:hypothetical protein